MRDQGAAMKIRTGRGARPQVLSGAEGLRRMLQPMVAGIAATKSDLMNWVHEVGLGALREMLRGEAEAIARPKGKEREGRTPHHWGPTSADPGIGGRPAARSRPPA